MAAVTDPACVMSAAAFLFAKETRYYELQND